MLATFHSQPEGRVDRKIRKSLTESLAVSVKTTSEALGTGPYAVYAGIRDGSIPHIRVGRKILVPTAPLRRLLGIDNDPPKAA
jgi:excisionase family DNA binding protein